MKANSNCIHSHLNKCLTYEISNAVEAIRFRSSFRLNHLNDLTQNQFNQFEANSASSKKKGTDLLLQNSSFSHLATDYHSTSQSNRGLAFNENNRSLFLNKQKKKPFIDRSYENDNEFLGLKNKVNYSAKVYQAAEDLQHKVNPQRDSSVNCFEPSSAPKAISMPQYGNANDKQIDELMKLPLDKQVLLLLNENKQLKDKEREYLRTIEQLSQSFSQGKGLNETNKEFKEYLIKENEDLTQLNRNYEEILETVIHFLNQLKKIAEGKPLNTSTTNENEEEIRLLNLNEIKANPLIVKTFLQNLNLTNHHREKINRLQRSKRNQRRDNFSKSNHSGHSYDYLSPERITNCLPCALGLNISSKGYSPLLCSPNRTKYNQRSQTPIK